MVGLVVLVPEVLEALAEVAVNVVVVVVDLYWISKEISGSGGVLET